MKTRQQIAEELVAAIITDLSDRSGFDHCWDNTDEDVRQEIREHWAAILLPHLQETP